MTEATETVTQPTEKQRRKVLVATTIGAALEWYDFTLYGIASAVVLAPLFFPSEDPLFSLLGALASYGVGLFARPFGSFFFGNMGDKLGRQKILVITLILMSVSTFLIGCLPTFDTIGYWAPAILVLLRILQGLGAGSEYAGATLMAFEYAPKHRRGLLAAIPATGNPLGMLLASAVFGAVAMLPTDDFMSWGWRIPFLLSALLFVIGLYIRSRVEESPAFEKAKLERPTARTGMGELFRNHRGPFVKALMLNGGPNVTGYLPAAFGLAYMTATLKFPPSVGVTIFAISNFVLLAVQPLAGLLADKVGGRRVFIGGAMLGAASAFPFFWFLESGEPPLIMLAYLLLFTFSGGIMLGAQASFLADQFPTEVRFSGVAISRELASGLVGGTLPIIATALTSAVNGTWLIGLLSLVLMLIAILGAYLSRGLKAEPVFTPASTS